MVGAAVVVGGVVVGAWVVVVAGSVVVVAMVVVGARVVVTGRATGAGLMQRGWRIFVGVEVSEPLPMVWMFVPNQSVYEKSSKLWQ